MTLPVTATTSTYRILLYVLIPLPVVSHLFYVWYSTTCFAVFNFHAYTTITRLLCFSGIRSDIFFVISWTGRAGRLGLGLWKIVLPIPPLLLIIAPFDHCMDVTVHSKTYRCLSVYEQIVFVLQWRYYRYCVAWMSARFE